MEVNIDALGAIALKAVTGGAAVIGAILGIGKWREARKRQRDKWIDSLATKDQVERHRQRNEEQVLALRGELEKLHESQSAQNGRLDGIQQSISDMPLKIINALKGG